MEINQYKNTQQRTWKTKEQLEQERKQREVEKQKAIIHSKAIAESIWKANLCPSCKEGQLKIIKRKNYPFGRNSKPIITHVKKCRLCNYSKIIQNGNHNKK